MYDISHPIVIIFTFY